MSKLGYLGLQDKEKAKPQMPNQIKPDKEKIILNYIIEYPTHGLRRIANELNQQDITIIEAGIYNVLRRRKLNHRLDRLFYAQDKSDNPLVTERYLREVAKRYYLYIEPLNVLALRGGYNLEYQNLLFLTSSLNKIIS